MKGPIKSITSPTHTIVASQDESMIQKIEYHSEDFLQRDFVLIIKADGLDAPRCFVERHPTGTVAMQLAMVPKFDLPPIDSQEYIFVVDRSGSMHGARIETARNALMMLLHALPSRGTTFNIFSFGRICDSLFPRSVEYTEETLVEAVSVLFTSFSSHHLTAILPFGRLGMPMA